MRHEIVFRNIINGGLQGDEFSFICPVDGVPNIPRGANPRKPALTKVVHNMVETLSSNPRKFSNMNRGISLVCHDFCWEPTGRYTPSGDQLWDLRVDVSNAGTATGIGHWDGGHTQLAVETFMAKDGTHLPSGASVKIHLTCRSRYANVQEIRDCANQQNTIQRQQAWSEANLRGSFENIKDRWASSFPRAVVEYEQNEHEVGEADYIVMSILKLGFALLEKGENYYLGYGSKGKNPVHSPIAHAMAPGDITDKFEKYLSKYESLPLEIWAMFADFVRMDIDKSHAKTKVREKLLDEETGASYSKTTPLHSTHYAKMIIHSGSNKRIDSLFNGEKLPLNAVDMNCIYPIVHAFAMRFMECDPEDGIVWKDGKGRPLSSTSDMAILDMLKRAWKKVDKDVLQAMVTEFNTNYPIVENSTNGFWPKTSSFFSKLRELVRTTRKLHPIAINKKRKHWDNSPAEQKMMVEWLENNAPEGGWGAWQNSEKENG